MTKFSFGLPLLMGAALFSSSVLAHGKHEHSHDAHVHGVGNLEVVQDGKRLLVGLYTPLQNVLGFEHSPKTDSEKVKARRVLALLKASGLFKFTPAAQCKRTAFTLDSNILKPYDQDSTVARPPVQPSDGHSDLMVNYEFECVAPEKLKSIEVNLFRQFSGFEKIDVQAVFPGGQIGAYLTPKKSTLLVQ
jgi:hypothetical protein